VFRIKGIGTIFANSYCKQLRVGIVLFQELNDMASKATYTRLKDGSWGIRTTFAASAGSIVEVKKQSGEVKDEVVEKLIWSGSGVYLYAVRQAAKKEAAQRSQKCDDCGAPGATVACQDSSGISGICCARCARMSRFERSFC